MGIMDNFLKQLGTADQIHDYSHASKIFVDGTHRLSPKYAFMYYVRFELDNVGSNAMLKTPTSASLEIGALCKSATLPKYSVDTKVLNAYNRPNMVQSKLKYEPVTLKFHDDSASIIREFWYDYMTFFYRDSDYDQQLYNAEHKYNQRQRDQWGYGLRNGISGTNYQPIKSISIFSFHQKKFSEYKLINPIITAFRHGEHVASEGSSLLEHEMTLQYETVHYLKGDFSGDAFSKDMMLHYDKTLSPLMRPGATNTIVGPGGLLSSVNNVAVNLAGGNILGAAVGAYSTAQTWQGNNIKKTAVAEAQAFMGPYQLGSTSTAPVTAPTWQGTTAQGVATAGATAQVSQSVAKPSGVAETRDETYVQGQDPRAQSNGQAVGTPASVIGETKIASFPAATSNTATSSNTLLSYSVPPPGEPLPNVNYAESVIGTNQGTPT